MTVAAVKPQARAATSSISARSTALRAAKPTAPPPAPAVPARRRGFTPLTPMRKQAAQSMRRLAGHMQQTHPDMTTAQHIRDAARVLESGNEEAAQRHLRAAAFTLSPQSLMRHGLHTDDAHISARESMHGVHRHLLLVKDIEDAAAKNQAAINRDSYGDNPANLPPRPQPQPDPNAGYGPGALAQKPTARQPPGNQALNAPARTNSGASDPNVADPVGPQPRGSKQFARTWDELARVIDMTGDAQHHHIPGSPLIYEHGYVPLTMEAAHSHFKGKVPKGWTAPSPKGSGKTGKAATGSPEHAAAAYGIAANVRLERGLSRFQREEAEQRLRSAAGYLNAGDHAKAASELDEAMRAASMRGGGVIKGSTAAQARDLRDKVRAEHPAADAGKAGDEAKTGDDSKWWADTMPPEAPKPKTAPPPRWEQGGMFADPDRTGTAPMFGDPYGTSGVTEPGKGVMSGPHPADKMTIAADKHAAARSLSDGELGKANAELSRRAALLGKPGQLSKGQKAVQAEMKRRGIGMSVTWDDLARVIELVGPHGYIHGWIFIGVPVAGDKVFHPRHGPGTVTDTGGGRVAVSFDSGHSRDFPIRESSGPARFGHMTDDELVAEHARSTGSRANAAVAELDRRDRHDREAKAQRVSGLYAEKPKTEADRNRVYQGLVNEGEDPEEAWAHAHGASDEDMRRQSAIQDLRNQGYRGAGFDALTRAAYKDDVRRRTVMAENATNGYMLSPKGKQAGIDPYSLFTGPESRARKYASPELKEWFDQNGRPAASDFQAQLMGKKAGMKPADFYASVTWDDLSGVIELSARTAQLEVTPAPRGKPGGPGLYDVAGMGHTDYEQQIVKALIEKRGMDPHRAYAVARGAIRKWMRGGGNVHPEVRAAATAAEAGELARQARAKAAHGHAATWDDVSTVVELASRPEAIDLVGPHGYIHGWIYVGGPGLPSVAAHNAKLQAKGVTPPTKARPALTRKPPGTGAAAKSAPAVKEKARSAPQAAVASKAASNSPEAALDAAIKSGVASQKAPGSKKLALSQGKEGSTGVVTFGNGSQYIHKDFKGMVEHRPPVFGGDRPMPPELQKRQVAKEILAAKISKMIGAGAPDIMRDPDSPGGLYEPKVAGVSAVEHIKANGRKGMAKLYNSPDGLKIGLMDALTGNEDRHLGNVMISPDGKPIPIDHNDTWGMPAFDGSLFTDSPFTAALDKQIDAGKSPFSAADLDQVRQQIEALKPEFDAMPGGGGAKQYQMTMDKLAQIRGRVTGQ